MSAWKHELPNIAASEHRVTSEPTFAYNCYAWAAGLTDCWWDPAPGYYWPTRGGLRSRTIETVTGFYEKVYRFEKCASWDLEAGIEKVAIYADEANLVTHVARQKRNGVWTSKLCQYEDVEHDSPLTLVKEFGTIAQIMQRSLTDEEGA